MRSARVRSHLRDLRPYAAPFRERIDPGDPSLTGIECLLKEVSILGTSAAAEGQLAPPMPDHCNRGETRSTVFTLSLQQNW